jgi:uncharacterized membrane protein YidH (DUF202 family)
MDGARSSMRRIGSIAVVAAIAVVSSAHIGSPDVFYDGNAGPYKLHVRVSPPTVVPGVAWVYVRTAETDLDSIFIRPVFWRAGVQGAPPGEAMTRVAGESGLYAGKLWLMSRGPSSVYVDVTGARGKHTATVPVMAQATARLGLSMRLAAMLIALGLLLVSGLVAIVRAAASDSLVDPGRAPDQVARRRGSLGAVIALPALGVAIFGGARWWKAEDAAYQRTIYRPLAVNAMVATTGGAHLLRLAIRDTSSQNALWSPLMPDHGKMMHLFLIRESSMSAFAHLHPAREASGVFVSAIPAIPAGRYFVFGDIVLETGAEYTVTTAVDVPPPVIDTSSDPDDSWDADSFGVPAKAGARSALTPTVDLQWDEADSIVAGRDVELAFSTRNRKGAVVPVEPYLGMAAHAVVLREDGSVFIHLHPMGTMSMASQQAFAQRDRGDTTAAGRLRVADTAMKAKTKMVMAAAATTMDGRFSFPYAFPKPGRYRVWVQVKLGGKVETADYEVTVR